MTNPEKMISLGFTENRFPAGTHICQIFADDNERSESLLKFLLSGLKAGERSACFSEKVDEMTLSDIFTQNQLSYQDLVESQAFALSSCKEVYFQDNYFDPDRMLDLLSNFYQDSMDSGYDACRVIGEMTSEIHDIPGGERLLEYESKVSLLLEESPVTAICQYDANTFNGNAIMDILRVHPHMIVRGSVIQNPFYIPPKEFLAENGTS
ncbi:MAG: MEDS domain-containing protein [SAR324 cluster bacterium]|nr:MEDS domain-containing protein [SAR324 cluster bacterium]